MSPGIANSTARREAGTASVELIAVVPFLLLAVLVAAQLALAGQALWSAGVAARAGARASLVGRGAAQAARAALPPSMRAGTEIHGGAEIGEVSVSGPLADAAGAISVQVPVPRIVPGLPVMSVGASASLSSVRGPQGTPDSAATAGDG